MYYECVRTTSGLWELGSSMSDQDAMRIQSRVRIETENKPYPEMQQTAAAAAGFAATAPKGDAYLKELLSRQQRGDRLSEEEAFAFYNLQFPKMQGLKEENVKRFIKSIKEQTDNAKVVRGKRKLRKLAAIKDACYAAGLTKRGEDDKLIPIFQRGGRMNVQSKALARLFHAISGIVQKRKPKKDPDISAAAGTGKMQQPKMGAAQHGPMNGMHNWDPTLAGYMQPDYNMHDPGMMASQLYGGNPNVHPPAGLRLSGKFQAAAAAGTDSWTPYGGLMDFPAVLHRKYEPKEQIGSGAFATVYRAEIRATGKSCAVKRLEKRVSNESRLRIEVEALRRVSHPNITQLLDVAEHDEAVFLVIEYAAGGELFDAIVTRGNYTERDAMLVTTSVLQGLSCLHSHNVIHRDLKPENLLLSSKDTLTDVKITDFGMASILERDVRMTFTKGGTLQYVAPEIISSESGHSFPVDLWSLGVVVVCLLTGRGPFICRTLTDYVEAIRRIDETDGKCLFGPTWNGVSAEAQAFVQRLLRVQPERRPTAAQALQDPWLVNSSPSKRRRSDSAAELEDDNAKQRSRPLSANMERSHTDELRNFTFERKRLRIESGAQLAALESSSGSAPSLDDIKLSDIATPRGSTSSQISLSFDPGLPRSHRPSGGGRPTGGHGHRRQRSSLMHFLNAGMNADLSQLVDILSPTQDDSHTSLGFAQFLDDFSRTSTGAPMPRDSTSSLSGHMMPPRGSASSISAFPRDSSSSLSGGQVPRASTNSLAGHFQFVGNSTSSTSYSSGQLKFPRGSNSSTSFPAGQVPFSGSSSGGGSGAFPGSSGGSAGFPGNLQFPRDDDSSLSGRAQRESTGSLISLSSLGTPSPPPLHMPPKLRMLTELHRYTSNCSLGTINYNRIKNSLIEIGGPANFEELKPAISEYLRLVTLSSGSTLDQQLVCSIFERLIYLLNTKTDRGRTYDFLRSEFNKALLDKCTPFIDLIFASLPKDLFKIRKKHGESTLSAASVSAYDSQTMGTISDMMLLADDSGQI